MKIFPIPGSLTASIEPAIEESDWECKVVVPLYYTWGWIPRLWPCIRFTECDNLDERRVKLCDNFAKKVYKTKNIRTGLH